MHVLWRGSNAQRTRLISGLILFVFAATHFINHALGIVSLDAMNGFDAARVAVIRSVPGAVVLAGALIAHAGLSLSKVVERRTLKMAPWDAAQIVLGLAIPVLLVPHIVNTQVSHSLFGVQDTYAYELARIWTGSIVSQTALMLLVWVHGCIGLHFWLRLSGGYRRFAPALLALAVLIPFAAFVGISVQGRAVNAVIADPSMEATFRAATHWPGTAEQAQITTIRNAAQNGATLVVVGFVAIVALRLLYQRQARRIPVRYVGGPTVRSERGPTLLEISRMNNIPHMAVCGGRGRCSTCRVLVLSAQSSLEPASAAELQTLDAIAAGPNVRLACQARPLADTTVMTLLRVSDEPNPGPRLSRQIVERGYAGVEQDLAVLFVDMRGFTMLTERKLAFDVVFILNQFFATVGQPVYDMGGWINNYAGDGMIALFSDEAGIATACRAALMAAAEIDRAVSALNARLADEMQQPIQIAMGLHAGPHVVGRVGYRDSQAMSVIGLAINVASRLETMAKTAGVQIAMSATVADHGGLDAAGLQIEPKDVRGLQQPINVVFMMAARDITGRLRSSLSGAA